MTITSYFGLKPCCDCGRTGNYTVNKNGYQFTVCSDCVHNYSDEEEEEEEEEEKSIKQEDNKIIEWEYNPSLANNLMRGRLYFNDFRSLYKRL